jgi:hypothetical protein
VGHDRRTPKIRGITLAGCLIALSLGLIAPQSSSAGEHFRPCGDARGLGVEISAGGVSCRESRRILEAYFGNGESVTTVPVKGFAGWRCSSGDDGGTCARGRYLSGAPEINFFYLGQSSRAARISNQGCGTVVRGHDQVRVTILGGQVSCGQARQAARSYIAGEGTFHGPPGGPRSKQYVTLPRGWRCGVIEQGSVTCSRTGATIGLLV